MFKRVLFGSLIVLSGIAAISATVFAAGSLTERLEGRMTVLATDPVTSRFQCVEHRSWTMVVTSDLLKVHPGDIVRVQNQPDGDTRLVLLRTAADELGSPE